MYKFSDVRHHFDTQHSPDLRLPDFRPSAITPFGPRAGI